MGIFLYLICIHTEIESFTSCVLNLVQYTCATRAGSGVGTMWLIELFFNLYTDIVRTETARLPMELFRQPVSQSIDK